MTCDESREGFIRLVPGESPKQCPVVFKLHLVISVRLLLQGDNLFTIHQAILLACPP
jgi:hypothetical protein